MILARALGLAVAMMFFGAMTAPTLAGPPAGRGHGGPQTPGQLSGANDRAKGDMDKAQAVKDQKDEKGDAAKEADAKLGDAKKADDRKDDAKVDAKQGKNTAGNAHTNKGGKLRGLDRADQVAGEHGKQGRENAREKQERH